jgi:DNA-binding NtrC family response regulator
MSESRETQARLLELLGELRTVTSFEEAATCVLRHMLSVLEAALASSEYAGAGRIVRGLLHHRPDDGYRRLVELEVGAKRVTPLDRAKVRLPSATAWRWVAESRHAVAVDVTLGRVQVVGRGPDQARLDRRFAEGEFNSQESRARLIQRDVTHLLVLPLRSTGERIDGTLSLEAECRRAIGKPFFWDACAEELQAFADCAAPHLAALPMGPPPVTEADPWLPVAGASMASIVELLRVFAQQEEPILISGPTGAGKSRLARWCHENSNAAGRPFEVMDLSSVPEELQMAELFGWRKGAFTGAVRDNPGLVARARGGTLFIDEVDNLSARAQAGLLHVIEERTYRTLGESGPEKAAEVRFIIGTNARLQQAVREKRFREDLYYRINVLPVKLPPLCDRQDEIALWARFMANRRHAARVPSGCVELSAGAARRLELERWPGNLRQLDNIIRRAYAIALMSHEGVPPQHLVLAEDHVTRALAYEGVEGVEGSPSALDALIAAAATIVSQAERVERSGRGLDLDLVEGFKGVVLAAAAEKLGSREEAFRLFGRGKLVASRNHQKVYRREIERAESLCFALGIEGGLPFVKLAEPAMGPDSPQPDDAGDDSP